MKKIAIKSSIFAFCLTLLADIIMYVVTVNVIYVSRGLDHIVIHPSLPEGSEPLAPGWATYLALGSLLVFLIVLYFPPTFFAYINRVRARRWILLCNVFLGWTIVGWFVCFAWAFSLDRDSDRGSDSDSDQAAPSPSTS